MVSFAVACGGDTTGGGNVPLSPGGGRGGNSGGETPGSGNENGEDGNGEDGGDDGNTGGDAETPEPGDGSSGGGSGGSGGSNLTGSSVEILKTLDDELRSTGLQMPMTLPPSEVDPELSHNTIGLTEQELEKLTVSAAYNVAAIGTFAHQIIVIQAVSTNAAAEIKGIVSSPNGYDPQKWICVWPERAIVVEAGEYVLLVAAKADVVEAAIEAFRNEAGTIGTVVTFFEHEGLGEGEGGGFGGPGGAPIAIG